MARRRLAGYAYYFFRHRPTARLELRKAIRCLVAQLIIQQAEEDDSTPVSLHMLGRANAQEAPEPSLDETLDVLQASFEMFQETFLILDGLDLCTDDMIRTISRIVQKATKRRMRVRLVAFSRISMNAEDAIADSPQDTSDGFQWTRYYHCALIPRENITAAIDVCVRAGLGPIVRLLTTGTNSTLLSNSNLSSTLAQSSNGM